MKGSYHRYGCSCEYTPGILQDQIHIVLAELTQQTAQLYRKRYPYTILKCTYFNPVINKPQMDYQLYYMSEMTEKENARVRGFENIFNVSAQSLRELFVTPDLDKDGKNVIIPTWWGVSLP